MKRWLLPSIALLGLAACGGQSSGESRSPGAGTGSVDAAGSSSGSTANGGSGGDAAASGGSAGHVNRNERVGCFDWSQVNNQPKPGQSGILACPAYSDIDWVGSRGNCVVFADETPVPAEPGGDQGDCCYHYTYYECR